MAVILAEGLSSCGHLSKNATMTSTAKSNLKEEYQNSKPNDTCKIQKIKELLLRKDIIWENVLGLAALHIVGIYGILSINYIAHWKTLLWTYVVYMYTGFGITAGAHRLWSHKAFKATTAFRIFLMFCFITSGQKTVFNWVRDHRVHHKYTETDADPHNIKRGFFFAHVGWLLVKKKPEVIEKGKNIDMDDLKKDPVAYYSSKIYPVLLAICSAFTILVPMYFWGEDLYHACLFQLIRYMLVLNVAFNINSFSHFLGYKPFDRNIAATDNLLISSIALGEGWHNYHHVFPWDYRAPELGGKLRYDLTTSLLEFFSKFGWVYNLRQPSESLVKAVMERRGDGTLYCTSNCANDECKDECNDDEKTK